jgi:glycosyltransferase involved in cell wall biosynthesis
VPELLDALAAVPVCQLAWRGVLVSHGPVDTFQTSAERLDLGDRLSFPGWVDLPTASRLLGDAGSLLLPSHDEGMPTSVLEALSYGLAVICPPVGALPEVIEPEVSGLVVPVRNPDALVGALVRVTSDAGLRQKLGRNARRRSRTTLRFPAMPIGCCGSTATP